MEPLKRLTVLTLQPSANPALLAPYALLQQQYYRLRYGKYVTERGWEQENAARCERDAWDDSCTTILVVEDCTVGNDGIFRGKVVAGMRLIFSNSTGGPIPADAELKKLNITRQEPCVEISRVVGNGSARYCFPAADDAVRRAGNPAVYAVMGYRYAGTLERRVPDVLEDLAEGVLIKKKSGAFFKAVRIHQGKFPRNPSVRYEQCAA